MFKHFILPGICGAALASAGAVAFAATPAGASDANARYEQERARCMNGSSTEDQATCLKEAGAARDAAKKGQLTDDANFRKNELARCAALTGDDAKDCRARMKGSGTVSGSVAGGGILREKVTVTHGPTVSVPSSAASAP